MTLSHRVYLYADCDSGLILRRVHAQEAERLLKSGQAQRLCSGRKVRAIALTGVRPDDLDPESAAYKQESMSFVFLDHIKPGGEYSDWNGFSAYAMRLRMPDGRSITK
jgi:hypothetical protein